MRESLLVTDFPLVDPSLVSADRPAAIVDLYPLLRIAPDGGSQDASFVMRVLVSTHLFGDGIASPCYGRIVHNTRIA